MHVEAFVRQYTLNCFQISNSHRCQDAVANFSFYRPSLRLPPCPPPVANDPIISERAAPFQDISPARLLRVHTHLHSDVCKYRCRISTRFPANVDGNVKNISIYHGALRFPQGKDPCGIPQGHSQFSLWDFFPQGTFVHFKDPCGIL